MQTGLMQTCTRPDGASVLSIPYTGVRTRMTYSRIRDCSYFNRPSLRPHHRTQLADAHPRDFNLIDCARVDHQNGIAFIHTLPVSHPASAALPPQRHATARTDMSRHAPRRVATVALLIQEEASTRASRARAEARSPRCSAPVVHLLFAGLAYLALGIVACPTAL